MKKVFSIVLLIALGIVIGMVVNSPESVPQDISQPIPVEPDGGIGDGALPLEEIVELEESEGTRIPEREICVGEYCDGSMLGEGDFTVLQIPLISGRGDVGCGSGLFFAPHTVQPKTLAVLDATYRLLFDLKPLPEVESDDVRNVVGFEDMLFYNGVSLTSDGVARLELEGSTSYIYSCTIPEFRAQIEQAALQFDTVSSLEVYLNGELWDWCEYSQADPEEDGCNLTPKYWISSE
jgi:hypothetical protein